jgi:hypothetical protein
MVTAKFDYRDITATITALTTRSKTLQADLVKNLHEAAPGIQAEMRGRAGTRIQQRAASTVNIAKASDGMRIVGGQGGGLSAELFAGGEFGGRSPKKRVVANRSPLGRAYIVKRRATMMFTPHTGTEGTFYWPAVRDWLPKLYKKQVETVENVLGGKR